MDISKLASKRLPSPETDKSGWPWDESLALCPPAMPDGREWPRISIVTPSFNQGQFLEQTIRSVLLQNYPNLEYIVMDGGSTDNSVEIIKKYEKYITYWTSEKDNGQADAIYRGFERATGELIGWLNSDDLLLPGALISIGEYFTEHPGTELIIGGCLQIDENGHLVRGKKGMPRFNLGRNATFSDVLWTDSSFYQPATLWRRDIFFEIGGFDQSLYFCFDRDMYFRFTKRKPGRRVRMLIAAFRRHPESKTSSSIDICFLEQKKLFSRYGDAALPEWRKKIIKYMYKQKVLSAWRVDMLLGLFSRHTRMMLKLFSCLH